MLGKGDPLGAPTEPAPIPNIPRLRATHVGSSWPGRCLRDELLCQRDGLRNRGRVWLLRGEKGRDGAKYVVNSLAVGCTGHTSAR